MPSEAMGEHGTSCTELLAAHLREALRPAKVVLELRVAYLYRAHWQAGAYDPKYEPAVEALLKAHAAAQRARIRPDEEPDRVSILKGGSTTTAVEASLQTSKSRRSAGPRTTTAASQMMTRPYSWHTDVGKGRVEVFPKLRSSATPPAAPDAADVLAALSPPHGSAWCPRRARWVVHLVVAGWTTS